MKINGTNLTLNVILIFIAIGIWMIVLQNFNVFGNRQDVYVQGGNIDADVSGSVSVDNTVSVSIDEVLGRDGKKYYYSNR